jgi:hypothetical protein
MQNDEAPERPKEAEPPKEGVGKDEPPSSLKGAIGYVLLMFCLALSPLLCNNQREERILRVGVPAKARVTKIEPTGNFHNNQPEVTISLEIAPEGEAPFQSKVETYMSPVYLSRFQPGNTVDVRFDPKSRKDVALVPP